MSGIPSTQPAYTYDWQWRVQTSLPPPQKTCGSNTGSWSGATSMYLSPINYSGADCSATIRLLKANDTIRIEHKTDASIWSLWTLAIGPVEYPGSFTFPSLSLASQGAPADNTVYRITFTTGVSPAASISIPQHMENICLLASGMLARGDLNIPTIGDDSILLYEYICRSYLEEPYLPQPKPSPGLPPLASF